MHWRLKDLSNKTSTFAEKQLASESFFLIYSLNTFSPLLILLKKDKFLMAVWTRQTMVEVFTIACVRWIARGCYNWQKWFTAYADMGRKGFRREQRDPFNHSWKRNLKLDSVFQQWRCGEGPKKGGSFCTGELWNVALRLELTQLIIKVKTNQFDKEFVFFSFCAYPVG